MPHGGNGAGVFLIGPAILILLLAVLACVALIGVWAGRLGQGVALCRRARTRCARWRWASALWGLSAGALVFAVSALLVHTHALAFFGIALLLAGAVVLSLGLLVAAWATGRAVWEAAGEETRAGRSLGAGLAVLLVASCLPLIGWLFCLVVVATGTGAVLEALLTRE